MDRQRKKLIKKRYRFVNTVGYLTATLFLVLLIGGLIIGNIPLVITAVCLLPILIAVLIFSISYGTKLDRYRGELKYKRQLFKLKMVWEAYQIYDPIMMKKAYNSMSNDYCHYERHLANGIVFAGLLHDGSDKDKKEVGLRMEKFLNQ